MKLTRLITLILIATGITISSALISTYALFYGSHTLYENSTNAADFCSKCHPDKVNTINLSSNPHHNIGCACHGYNPNASHNINAAHNLTKNIYCTNCHTDYDITTGNITIHEGIAAPNQSAHYLINSSDKSAIYQRAKEFFNNSRR